MRPTSGRPQPRSWTLAALAVTALMLLGAGTANACPACGNPSLPQSSSGGGTISAGSLNVSVSVQTTTLRVTHPAGCTDPDQCDVAPVQPEHTHELFMVPLALTPAISWGVIDRLALNLAVPLRMVVARADYETPGGDPFDPVDEGVHHRSETLIGLGDLRLSARVAVRVGRWWLSLQPGLTLPTGRLEENPFALGDQGITHQHIQFGNGTVDPTLSVDVTRGLERAQVSLYAVGQASVYEARNGYRAGPRAMFGVAAGYKTTRALWSGTLEGSVEGPQEWDGAAQEDGLLGRQELRIGARAIWHLGGTTLGAGLQFPLVRRLVSGDEEAGELRSPVSLTISAAWAVRD